MSKALAVAVKNLNLDMEGEASLQPKKTMEDLPPEVMTIILDHLIKNESRNIVLGYRLVNSRWKDIIRSLLEIKVISGDVQAFPKIGVNCPQYHDFLRIDQSSTMFPADHNPFPSNSLVLGYTWDENPPESDIERMTIPDFMLRFGGYLTSFEIHRLSVSQLNCLVTLLTPMASLRVLRLLCAYLVDQPDLGYPAPPSLPSLTTLEIKSYCGLGNTGSIQPGQVRGEHKLFVWLIASYADQLVRLNVEPSSIFPALQPGLQYYYSSETGTTLPIAATSGSAFRNLKELQIYRPSKNFLRLSEFPTLQRLCVTRLHCHDYYQLDLKDLLCLIGKCRNTLERLVLDVDWKTLIGEEANRRYEREGTLPPPIVSSPHPKLKTLVIQYSTKQDRSEDPTISSFLALFPSLETLHFLRFPPKHTTAPDEVDDMNQNAGAENLSDQIEVVKSQLASLEQELYERTVRFIQQRTAVRRIEVNGDQWEQLAELEIDMMFFNAAAEISRNGIYKQLTDLGVRKQDVVVEQLLKHLGIWNIYRNLKKLSLSSGRTVEADVGVYQLVG